MDDNSKDSMKPATKDNPASNEIRVTKFMIDDAHSGTVVIKDSAL